MNSQKPPGKIITFYSYKGGTGRSMALANVAWLLASGGKKVLCVDWDLEAPGLHRYFSPFILDKDLAGSDGLINFIDRYANETFNLLLQEKEVPADWYEQHAALTSYAISVKGDFPPGGFLDFIPAGRQVAAYSTLVNLFDWKDLYERLGGQNLFEAVKAGLRQDYDYVLVDSRTGVSDTAGICTVQLPDAVVVCFTYNNQSIRGASSIARDIFEKRSRQGLAVGDSSPKSRTSAEFRIFPVPTRVEQVEQDKLSNRRRYAWSLFDPFLTYLPGATERRIYWHEVEVPYIPFFAFEEILAPFKEEMGDPRSMIASLLRLTMRLAQTLRDETLTVSPTLVSPEVRQRILQEFAQTPDAISTEAAAGISETDIEAQIRMAETVFTRLTLQDQMRAQRFLPRLVSVVRREEGGKYGPRRLPFDLLDLSPNDPLVDKLADAQLLNLVRDPDSGALKVELASEALIRQWTRLRNWIEQDLDFLLWRQKLGETVHDWEASGRKNDFAYRGNVLAEARDKIEGRRLDLNAAELAFINHSSLLEAQGQGQGRSGRRAFILRPFGRKVVGQEEVDFDRVEASLITPALAQLDILQRTSAGLTQFGNMREDVLQYLLAADLVIADLSINDANVFYELGIRHALRDKHTLLLRCTSNQVPFDLQRDRYFAYQPADPSASVDNLMQALTQTLSSNAQDSPIFRLLPELQVQGHARFFPVPGEFRQAVERATAERSPGDLDLLADELRGFRWESEGLRLVGRAQAELRYYEGARRTWEAVQVLVPNDLEAPMLLATIYQRLNDLELSDQSLRRVLLKEGLTSLQRTECLALVARNAKTRWRAAWQGSSPSERPTQALRSTYLENARAAYLEAFNNHLNSYYAGLNALAMSVIQTELATALPEVWAERFESDQEAENSLALALEQTAELKATVQQSVQAAKAMPSEQNTWLRVSEADCLFLTAKSSRRVVNAYRQVVAADNSPFVLDSMRRQIELYQQLGLLKDKVEAALSVIPAVDKTGGPAESAAGARAQRVLVFIGHMIDRPDRKVPRFPAAKESVAREAIKEVVSAEKALADGRITGIAGASSGGDILFHEICAEQGLPSTLYLAIPEEHYVEIGVRPSGGNWMERYGWLTRQLPIRRMSDSSDLPLWLREKKDYDVWQRNNLWMLFNAMARGAESVTLIALWNGQAGSAADMVAKARERGAKTIILDTRALFGS